MSFVLSVEQIKIQMQILGDLFNCPPPISAPKRKPPISQSQPFLITRFTGTAAVIGWLAIFFLVLKLGRNSQKNHPVLKINRNWCKKHPFFQSSFIICFLLTCLFNLDLLMNLRLHAVHPGKASYRASFKWMLSIHLVLIIIKFALNWYIIVHTVKTYNQF